MCQICSASFSHTSYISDILIYTIIYNTYNTYTMSYHTILCHTIHTVHTIPAHTVIYDTVQCIYTIYTHTLIYSNATTPPHDLLLLHQDIHIIPAYTSPSAMPYIIIHHTNNRVQKQDRQQTYNRRT